MAISQTTGTATNNSGAVSSLALSAFTTTTGRTLVLVVVLGSTSSSVSSITNAGGTYSWTLRSSQNGTGVRTETWTSPVTTGASTTFTVNITGGATSISAEVEEYSGVSSIGHVSTATGADVNLMDLGVLTQDGNNWVITGFGFVCQSGDTLTAQSTGTSRQSSIPAATAVGGALYDNTQPLAATFGNATKLSTSRNWAAASVELRTGATAITAKDYGGSVVASLQADRDVRYLHCLEPLWCQQTPIENVGSAVNYGFVA